MSKEKQIEEMAREMCHLSKEFATCEECNKDYDMVDDSPCYFQCVANLINEHGYRKQEWISVEDRLPDGDGNFLVWNDYHGAIVGHYWARGRYFISKACSVTHWMPLPEAPKMKGGEE